MRRKIIQDDALAPTLGFEKEWDCLATEYDSLDPRMSTDESVQTLAGLGRGGYFIKSPYMEIAHFLVVQKMLSRYQTIHSYMDSAKDLFLPAMVTYRSAYLPAAPTRSAPLPDRVAPRRPKRQRWSCFSMRRERSENGNEPYR